MNKKIPILTGLLVALIANGASPRTAHAQSVTTLDPGDFTPGTNVTGAFSGVTLLSFSLEDVGTLPSGLPLYVPSYAPVYAGNYDDAFDSTVKYTFNRLLTPGDGGYAAMYGGIGGSCFTACSYPDRPDTFGTNLLIEFASPVSSVSTLDVGDSYNFVDMEAFNASNQIIGNCSTTTSPNEGSPQPLGNYGCYSVLSLGEFANQVETTISASTGSGISKILIGGYNNDYSISTITYTAAPEIDPASAAGGVALLFGGLMVLRGRREDI